MFLLLGVTSVNLFVHLLILPVMLRSIFWLMGVRLLTLNLLNTKGKFGHRQWRKTLVPVRTLKCLFTLPTVLTVLILFGLVAVIKV